MKRACSMDEDGFRVGFLILQMYIIEIFDASGMTFSSVGTEIAVGTNYRHIAECF